MEDVWKIYDLLSRDICSALWGTYQHDGSGMCCGCERIDRSTFYCRLLLISCTEYHRMYFYICNETNPCIAGQDCSVFFQFKAVGFYLWTGREFSDSSAAHDTESRIPRHQLHASAIVPRPSHNRGPGLIPWTYKVPCYLPQFEQWAATQTGEFWNVWIADCNLIGRSWSLFIVL